MEVIHMPLGERVIPLSVRRHLRARRISLRLSAARDGVVLTLPRRASVESGMQFFTSKADWVLANVEQGASVMFVGGAVLPLLGEQVTIRHRAGRGISELKENELYIHGNPEFAARRVKDFLKKYLREISLPKARAMAETIGKKVHEVRIRDTRSRWGSCTTGGVLTFNWRLVFAPPEILDYLIAHEVAHLLHMNHSERFWDTVTQLCPGREAARKWLKHEGHRLHRYG